MRRGWIGGWRTRGKSPSRFGAAAGAQIARAVAGETARERKAGRRGRQPRRLLAASFATGFAEARSPGGGELLSGHAPRLEAIAVRGGQLGGADRRRDRRAGPTARVVDAEVATTWQVIRGSRRRVVGFRRAACW
jgi:hypothetical protein